MNEICRKYAPFSALLLVIIALAGSRQRAVQMSAKKAPQQKGSSTESLFLLDTKILRELPELSFGEMLENQIQGSSKLPSVTLESLRSHLKRDLDYQKRLINSPALPYSGPIAEFDLEWLSSPKTSFELIALVNRVDRALTKRESCGEVRLIYRLRYDFEENGREFKSRLPIAVNLVFRLGPDGAGSCHRVFQDSSLNVGSNARKILGTSTVWGPILRHKKVFDTLEINVQLSRWPAVYNSQFAEQTHYLLRVFNRDPNGRLSAGLLENTPNVVALKKDPELLEKLRFWIIENLQKIDQGTFVLPDEFLARKGISISPFGLNRRANRLYSALFSDDVFADLDLSNYKYIRSPQALVRRLDTFTCVGCHQSRAVAGFHMLGNAGGPLGFNQLATAFSAHVHGVIPWREKVYKTLINGSSLDTTYIPSPERSEYVVPAIGSHCGLGEDPGFIEWTCPAEQACYDAYPRSDIAGNVGTCYPRNLQYDGAPCDEQKLITNFHPALDVLVPKNGQNCPKGSVCATSVNGFPAGLCASRCSESTDKMVCLDAPELGPFSECLKNKKPFQDCLRQHSFRAAVPACDDSRPCRDEYVCLADESGRGACLPPYVLPQLNIDNHPPL